MSAQVGQRAEKPLPVGLVAKDRLPPVSAIEHVVNCSGKLHWGFARHPSRLTDSGIFVQRLKSEMLRLTPLPSGQRGAILYTIIESCRRRGLDPHAYLHDVLTRVPKMTKWQIKDITPEAWAKAQQCRPLQAAS